MSQLSVIVKQIDHCIEKWNDLKIPLDQYCERVSKGDLDAVKSLRTHISLLESFLHDLETNHRNSLEKFQQKINQVDPVTGERRFGKQSQEKFQHTSQLFHSLIAQCQSTLPHMLTICGDAECQLGEIEMKKEGEMQKIADDRYRHEEEQRLILELQQREAAEKRRREEEEIARLHEKAELIRKRKNEEASTLKAFESQFHRDLLRFTDQLQCIHGNVSRESKLQHLQFIKTKVGNKTKEVISFIINILERIISKPDNINARKLRLTQSVIQDKLTSSAGCLQFMVSIGFKLLVKYNEEFLLHDAGGSSEIASTWCRSLDQMEQLAGALSMILHGLASMDPINISDFSRIVDILNPNTPFDIVLEMEEPQLENLLLLSKSNCEKDAWLEWYDGLKENKTILEEFLPFCSTS